MSLDETTYLIKSSTGLEKDSFQQDETLKRAYVRSLEIIGEAVKQLPDSLRQKYCQIEWRALAGMRDRFIHNYFGMLSSIKSSSWILRLDSLFKRNTQG
jgi:uncharacterized protein with HEPN domain